MQRSSGSTFTVTGKPSPITHCRQITLIPPPAQLISLSISPPQTEPHFNSSNCSHVSHSLPRLRCLHLHNASHPQPCIVYRHRNAVNGIYRMETTPLPPNRYISQVILQYFRRSKPHRITNLHPYPKPAYLSHNNAHTNGPAIFQRSLHPSATLYLHQHPHHLTKTAPSPSILVCYPRQLRFLPLSPQIRPHPPHKTSLYGRPTPHSGSFIKILPTTALAFVLRVRGPQAAQCTVQKRTRS